MARLKKVEQQEIMQPIINVFPVLTIRQAHVLLQCIALGMAEGIIVDGEYVHSVEWERLIRQIIRK